MKENNGSGHSYLKRALVVHPTSHKLLMWRLLKLQVEGKDIQISIS
jgi:hypothetical protein